MNNILNQYLQGDYTINNFYPITDYENLLGIKKFKATKHIDDKEYVGFGPTPSSAVFALLGLVNNLNMIEFNGDNYKVIRSAKSEYLGWLGCSV